MTKRKISDFFVKPVPKKRRSVDALSPQPASNHSRPESGCVNLNSNCYLSCVVQVLANCPALLDVVLRLPTECVTPGPNKAVELQRLVASLLPGVHPTNNNNQITTFCQVWRKDPNKNGDVAENYMEVANFLTNMTVNTSLENVTKRTLYSVGHNAQYAIINLPSDISSVEQGLAMKGKEEKMTSLADLLCIQLARVTFVEEEKEIRRNNKPVHYSTELSVEALADLSSMEMIQKYDLVGVVVHGQKNRFPHYYIYYKVGQDWVKFDDLEVTQVKEDEALSFAGNIEKEEYQPLATMLFYSSSPTQARTKPTVPEHIVEAVQREQRDRLLQTPVLTIKLVDSDQLYNDVYTLFDEENLHYLTYHIYDQDLETAVISHLSGHLGYSPAQLKIRAIQADGDVQAIRLEQSMVHDSLTFGDLLKEVGGEPEVRPTFRFLFGERSSDHRSILSIKVFNSDRFYTREVRPADEETSIQDLLLSMSLDSYNAFRVQNLMVEKVDLLTKCSRLWVDGHVPVILLEEGDNKKLPNFIQRRMMEVRVVLENEEGGARTSVNLASDMSTTRVMETICLALSLKSDYLRLTALNTGSEREPPLLSGCDLEPVIGRMYRSEIPRVLLYKSLDIPLRELETLRVINVTLLRLDLAEPTKREIIVQKEYKTAKDLMAGLCPQDIPLSEDIIWMFCGLDNGRVSKLFPMCEPLETFLNNLACELGVVEVPVSGELVSFFTYDTQYHQQSGVPGIVHLHSGEKESSFTARVEEVINDEGQFKIFDSDMFPEHFSFACIKKASHKLESGQHVFTHYLGIQKKR